MDQHSTVQIIAQYQKLMCGWYRCYSVRPCTSHGVCEPIFSVPVRPLKSWSDRTSWAI